MAAQQTAEKRTLKKEWYDACRAAEVSAEMLRRGAPFPSWAALQAAAAQYNHRVVSVEFAGYADVYNGTVDEHHNFYVGGFTGVTRSGKEKQVYINNRNCGEEPLEPYGDCCLGSLNLAVFVQHPFTPNATLDLPALERATRLTVRFLDDVLTWNRGRHPLPQQEAAAEQGRRIGANFMGLADMLAQLGLRYDTDEAIEKTEQIVQTLKLWAYDESANLALEKGPFPVFDATRHFDNPFFASFPPTLLEKMRRNGLRNVTLLTVPPTGTVAALAGCTSGIEPIFDLSYTRRSESLSQSEFQVTHPLVAQYRAQHHLGPDALLPPPFVTAHTINPEKRVLMQAAIQTHIDQSLSSTINLPPDTPVETVERIYRQAWEAGCKGITVYRSARGCLANPLKPFSGWARLGQTWKPTPKPWAG